ncbi:hypothetical protein [Ferrovibrio sp.]|uniref:hypothetical protein n=1 Tax=Ferrovibrio sp. TaxID=1917215 RepID=UPI0026238584|nr:hypothetical protein [Ferrovibrio sp.]
MKKAGLMAGFFCADAAMMPNRASDLDVDLLAGAGRGGRRRDRGRGGDLLDILKTGRHGTEHGKLLIARDLQSDEIQLLLNARYGFHAMPLKYCKQKFSLSGGLDQGD